MLKILSRQITHKSDVGGVRLDLEGSAIVTAAAEAMSKQVKAARPDAVIDGFTVQKMIRRPHAQELLLGATTDPTFGPCLLFGNGGVAAEVIGDRVLGLPPLSGALAMDMIDRTRVAKLLKGYRDRPPARMEAISAALVALSDLVVDHPEIAELDINPLLADEHGVVVVDARIILHAADDRRPALAIRPYPAELVHSVEIGGLAITMRPIRPEDFGSLVAMAERTDPKDLQLRFHGAIRTVSSPAAARLSQIDYDREMVFVAEMQDETVGGVVRLVFDPNFESAECAIIVRTDLQLRGIGQALLSQALRYARSRGAVRVWGDVMSENAKTLDLARRLGGSLAGSPADRALTRVTISLET